MSDEPWMFFAYTVVGELINAEWVTIADLT